MSETRVLCGECGLPIPACNRIAMLEMQVKELASAVLQASTRVVRHSGDYTITASSISDDKRHALEDIAYGVGRKREAT